MGKNVSFSFELFPGNMKFIAYVNGELIQLNISLAFQLSIMMTVLH